jgi:hypothetical protein
MNRLVYSDMEKNEFIKFLKKSKSKISYVNHISKSNSALQELNDIESDVRHTCVLYYNLSWDEFKTIGTTRHLQISSRILEKYPYRGSDKRKNENIEEFKKGYTYDLGKMIYDLEYQANDQAGIDVKVPD